MLARRMTVLLVAGFAVVAAVQAFASGRRTIALFDDRAHTQLRSAGQVLQDAALDAYRRGGEEGVRKLLGQAAERLGGSEAGTEVRWVWIDAPPGTPLAPRNERAALAPLADGGYVELERDEADGRRMYYYAPAVREPRVGAIELSRPRARRAELVRAVVIGQVILVAAELLALALLALLLLSRLVGAPLRRLTDQLGRLGRAQTAAAPAAGAAAYSGELARLAREVEALRERLADADQRAVAEITRGMADHEELHAANRLVTVGKLAASMAHELGTPLGVVQARAQMLAAGEVSLEEVGKDADIIVQQTKRMEKMVREVLDLARPKAPTNAPIDVVALVRQTVSMLEPLARKQNVRLRLEGEPEPAQARGDASKLLQVLTNLVMNAAQAMPKGGSVWLSIARRRARPPETHGGREAEYLCLQVRDEGTGIGADHLPRVFDTFFTTKKEGEGTGLGLSVSYRIAREHGGWIAVDSELGRGSTFTVYLPAGGGT